jgi:hypothetical protein
MAEHHSFGHQVGLMASAGDAPLLHQHGRRKSTSEGKLGQCGMHRTMRDAMSNDNWIRDITQDILCHIADYVLL